MQAANGSHQLGLCLGRQSDRGLSRPAQGGDEDPGVADQHRDGEDDVDREQPVEADVEIRGLLDLHEGHVVPDRRQRPAVEGQQRDGAERGHDPARRGGRRRPQITSKRISSASRSTKAAPQSTSHSHMMMVSSDAPADREVQQIAEHDLDDERDEHHGRSSRPARSRRGGAASARWASVVPSRASRCQRAPGATLAAARASRVRAR